MVLVAIFDHDLNLDLDLGCCEPLRKFKFVQTLIEAIARSRKDVEPDSLLDKPLRKYVGVPSRMYASLFFLRAVGARQVGDRRHACVSRMPQHQQVPFAIVLVAVCSLQSFTNYAGCMLPPQRGR
jgi:hypothetical protein